MTNRRGARALLGLVLALTGIATAGGSAIAHTPNQSMACEGPYAYVTANGTQYNGTNHITITVDGATRVSQDFGTGYAFHLNAGSGFVAHQAVVTVAAHDDPTGSHGWSFTANLSAPACKEHTPPPPPPSGHLRASILGPCLDPKYLGEFRNTTSHTATFDFSWVDYTSHTRRHDVRHVPGHASTRTPLRHALAGTTLTIRANGSLLTSRKADKAGYYGKPPACLN